MFSVTLLPFTCSRVSYVMATILGHGITVI
jgi:hypothetical protein